jgi:uncharacterized protein YraI
MSITLNDITILQAVQDTTGWRPTMQGATTNTGANVRSGPSVNTPIVATLKPGVRVVVLGIVDNGMTLVIPAGWISQELLTLEDGPE